MGRRTGNGIAPLGMKGIITSLFSDCIGGAQRVDTSYHHNIIGIAHRTEFGGTDDYSYIIRLAMGVSMSMSDGCF
jgi:hypothetical protein